MVPPVAPPNLAEQHLLAVAGCAFELEHPALRVEAARGREAVELAVRGKDPVARDDDRERVLGERRSDVASTFEVLAADRAGDLAVAARGAGRDLTSRRVDGAS